jgi:hypothetical protein
MALLFIIKIPVLLSMNTKRTSVGLSVAIAIGFLMTLVMVPGGASATNSPVHPACVASNHANCVGGCVPNCGSSGGALTGYFTASWTNPNTGVTETACMASNMDGTTYVTSGNCANQNIAIGDIWYQDMESCSNGSCKGVPANTYPVFMVAYPSGGYSPYTYSWHYYPGPVTQSGGTNAVVSGQAPGIDYFVSCSSSVGAVKDCSTTYYTVLTITDSHGTSIQIPEKDSQTIPFTIDNSLFSLDCDSTFGCITT